VDAAVGTAETGVVVETDEDSGGGSSVSGGQRGGNSVSSGPQSSMSSSVKVSQRVHMLYNSMIPIGHRVVSWTKQSLLVLYQVLDNIFSRGPYLSRESLTQAFPLLHANILTLLDKARKH
jgi:hypothetical protein